MVRNGNEILVYNPKLAKIPGVNPLKLKSLKEYKEYVEWQRASGLKCPILHLEKGISSSGFEQLAVAPSYDADIAIGAMNHDLPVVHATPPVSGNKVGQYLDSTQDFPPFNNESFPSYDPESNHRTHHTN